MKQTMISSHVLQLPEKMSLDLVYDNKLWFNIPISPYLDVHNYG